MTMELDKLMDTPCFRQCGIVPWDTSGDKHWEAIDEEQDMQPTLWDPSSISATQGEGERWERDRLLVFTDGSSMWPDYTTIQRGGWGVYVGPQHPCGRSQVAPAERGHPDAG